MQITLVSVFSHSLSKQEIREVKKRPSVEINSKFILKDLTQKLKYKQWIMVMVLTLLFMLWLEKILKGRASKSLLL